MLDFLFALGQFICFIGLLYGLMLSVVNDKYSGAVRFRYDPVTGDDCDRDRDVSQHELRLMIVPTPPIAQRRTLISPVFAKQADSSLM
jgi:hypothetical protein